MDVSYSIRGPVFRSRRPYLNERMTLYWQGVPHLPQFVQGQFWRLTGSVNRVGLSTYKPFVIFLGYCHFALKARFWCVALIMTTPLVLIHALPVGYVDLFANSFLAIGVVTLAHAHINDDDHRIDLMTCGLMGLVCGLVKRLIDACRSSIPWIVRLHLRPDVPMVSRAEPTLSMAYSLQPASSQRFHM